MIIGDLIDDFAFDQCLPPREEMLKHQCDLLCSELDVTRLDLRQVHKNLAGMICMWRDSSKELAALRLEHERLRWTLSDLYRRETERETSRMTYAYGDHSKSQR